MESNYHKTPYLLDPNCLLPHHRDINVSLPSPFQISCKNISEAELQYPKPSRQGVLGNKLSMSMWVLQGANTKVELEKLRCARYLLGGSPLSNKGKESTTKQGESSDPKTDQIPVWGERAGRIVWAKAQTPVLRKFWPSQWGILSNSCSLKESHVGGRNGLALRPLLCLVTYSQPCGENRILAHTWWMQMEKWGVVHQACPLQQVLLEVWMAYTHSHSTRGWEGIDTGAESNNP